MIRYSTVETPAAGVSRSPLRVALLLNSTGHHPAVLTAGGSERWVTLDAHRAYTGPVVRVQSADLRDAGRRTREVRADAAQHRIPDPMVFLDVRVLVDPEPRGALDTLA